MKNKQKKPKNWKLRAGVFALAPIGIIAASASVISCGTNGRSEIIKTNLNDLHLKTILSMPVTNQQAAFDLFIKLNPEVSDLETNVEIVDFNAPLINKTGSLTIQAKPNMKYSGTLTITIPEPNKTDITRLINNQTIQGTENMTVDQAFQAFLEANNSWTNLNDYVEVDSFTAATYTSNGSLTIKAKASTAYTGSVMVRINAIGQTSLNDLHLKTLLSLPVTNQQTAFDLFIKSNSNIGDLKDDLEIISFNTPDYNQTGSLTIATKVDGKYIGTLTITIPELIKTDIIHFVTNTTIQGTENMTVDQAFEAFLEANNSWPNLSDYVEVGEFTAPNSKDNGSLIIKTKEDREYTGTITIKIIMTTDLADLNLEATVAVDLSATPEEVFQAFLDKNQSILDDGLTLNQVELTDFHAPEYLQNGHLKVAAKKISTNKWTGDIELRIKYILSEDNFTDIFSYLSDNDLLKFNVNVGRIKTLGDLAAVAREILNGEMKQYYEYDQNIKEIRLHQWSWNFPEGTTEPSVEELNTKGFSLHLPRFYGVIALDHPDGSTTLIDRDWNVYWMIV